MQNHDISTTALCESTMHPATMRARFRNTSICSVVVLLCVSVIGISARGQAYQTNWEPNRYKVECTHGNCLTNLHPTIEGNLVDIVSKYKNDSWKAQSKFGPVVGTGAAARTIIADTSEDRYAWTSTGSDCETSTVSFGKKISVIENRPHFLYFFLAHEMFHVTQRRYAALDTCTEKRHGWVQESFATAVGMDFARKAHPAAFPIKTPAPHTEKQTLLDVNLNEREVVFDVMQREVLLDAGGREYHVPLNLVQLDANDKEVDSGDLRHYRTSGLWRHIAEVYHDGSYLFVQKYLDREANNNDWLEWAHKNVDNDLKTPLARVFALYMADVANWYRKDQPAMVFSETEWHKILYDGCLKYAISPANPLVKVDIVMNRSSARCIQITAEGLKPAERKAINAGAFPLAYDWKHVDPLQLSLASSTDKVGLDCSAALRSNDRKERLIARDKCVFGFGTGDIKVDGDVRSGRIWDVVPQETNGGSSFTNTYILSRLSPNPTDDQKGDDGGAQVKISAVFVLDSPDAMIDNQKLGTQRTIGLFNGLPAKYVPAVFGLDGTTEEMNSQSLKPMRIVGHLNGSPANYAQETVPRFGKDGKQAIATVTPGAVMPSVPVFDMFGANPALSPGGNPANRGGIWLMRFTAVEVEEDGMYQQSLVERDHIAAYPYDGDGKEPRPLQIGDKGQFKAVVSAKVGLRNFATRTPATITVDEYTLFVLRARIEGTLCEVMMDRRPSNECINPQPFSANMVKAFAGLHDPSSRFVIEDTPAARQYARFRQELINEALRQMDPNTPSPPDTGTGGSGKGTVVIDGCTCSCDDMPYLMKLQERIKSGQRLSAADTKKLQDKMRCMATCTPHYMTCK